MSPPSPTSTLFPTRRSSDLVFHATTINTAMLIEDQAPHILIFDVFNNRADLFAAGAIAIWIQLGFNCFRNRAESRRSEEHTSELQSHHDLVCRLLLEK